VQSLRRNDGYEKGHITFPFEAWNFQEKVRRQKVVDEEGVEPSTLWTIFQRFVRWG
jgi:hypothetical protein